MHNDLVLSDLGRTVTRITDGTNDRYLCQACLSEIPSNKDISASNVPIRKFVTRSFQCDTCPSEISSHSDYKR